MKNEISVDIPEYLFNQFKNKIEKINKRCRKFQFPEFTYKINKTYEKKIIQSDSNFIMPAYLKMLNISVFGEIPYIENWEVIGIIEYTDNYNTIVRNFSNIQIPNEFLNQGKPKCQHCNAKKIKKYAVVIYNKENKNYKLIGKACLKDYCKLDANNVFSYYSYIDELNKNDDYENNKNNFDIKVYDFIKICILIIQKYGYVKRFDDIVSTADLLFDYFFNNNKESEKLRNEINKSLNDITDEMIDNYIDYIFDQDSSNNNFIHNCQSILYSDYISNKYFSIIAGSIYNWINNQNKEKNSFSNEYIDANIGDKITLSVTFITSKAFTTRYGMSYLNIFMDENKNKIITFTNKQFDNGTYKITGKVKAFSEYNNMKQTQLSHVKIIK